MKKEDIMIMSGDNIHIIWYYDHALEQNVRKDPKDFIEEIKNNPHILISVGKIINGENDPFYAIMASGAYNRAKKPYNVEIIRKENIIKKEVIFTIP